MSDELQTFTSRYAEVKLPTEASAIPAHLVEKLNAHERYLVDTISRMEQLVTWLKAVAVANNLAIRDLDRRLEKIERWHAFIGSYKGVAVWVATVIIPLVLEYFVLKLHK